MQEREKWTFNTKYNLIGATLNKDKVRSHPIQHTTEVERQQIRLCVQPLVKTQETFHSFHLTSRYTHDI
ncbi:hypothetical protein DPMN_163096 [Dreissena polymorpha]|uniref:Uncharacterized protein n=1 Tax=Dreissena polymorpha TaxID=45954 RepID=A0A9D4IUW1_DREPO|nr:hypothetical protein DPMN_163096 [Dreissena polymorpha]